MKTLFTLILCPALVSGLMLAGCSSSEDAAKTEPTPPPAGEMTRTDTAPATVPDTPTPPDVVKTETPPADRPSTPPATPPQADQPPVTTTPQKTGMMMWSVQIGAFKAESGADKTVSEAKTKFNAFAVYKDYDSVTGFYKVTVGSFQLRDDAAKLKEKVRAQGYPEAFVVEVRR